MTKYGREEKGKVWENSFYAEVFLLREMDIFLEILRKNYYTIFNLKCVVSVVSIDNKCRIIFLFFRLLIN